MPSAGDRSRAIAGLQHTCHQGLAIRPQLAQAGQLAVLWELIVGVKERRNCLVT